MIARLSKLLAGKLIGLASPLAQLGSIARDSVIHARTSGRTAKVITLAINPFTNGVATGSATSFCLLRGFEAGSLGRGHFCGVWVLLVAWPIGRVTGRRVVGGGGGGLETLPVGAGPAAAPVVVAGRSVVRVGPLLRWSCLPAADREHLTGTTLELLAEEDELDLVVDGQDTGTSNTTEDVGTSTLEERLDTLSGDDLAGSVEGTVVLDGLTGGHHHTTTDSVKRVGSDTSTSGDGPTEEERGEEVALEGTDEENGLERVVHTEVETTVDNDTSDGGHETTVETGNTVRGKGLLVDIDETVELALTRALGGLGVVGKTGTGVVEGVDEGKGSGTSSLDEGQSVENMDFVTTPEGDDTLIGGGTSEAVGNTVVLVGETASLKHLILVLDEELDTLNGGSSGLRDGGGNTTHQERTRDNSSKSGQCIDSSKLGEFGAGCIDLSRIFVRKLDGVTYGHAEDALVSLVSGHFDVFLNGNKTKREERMEKGKKRCIPEADDLRLSSAAASKTSINSSVRIHQL
ncbi:ADP,ATP carrier protein, partial [Aureobasidium melanogenum]